MKNKHLTLDHGTGLILQVSRIFNQIHSVMPLQKGEVYQCPEKNCGCEVTVTKGAPSDCSGTQNPTCCCGKTMVKKN